jgi:hypothetical protein
MHLGDTEVPGGQWAQDNYLQPFVSSSYQSLYRWLQRNHAQLVRRTSYFNLPVNTSYLTPTDAGIANLGQPENIFQRKAGTTWTGTVAAINAGTPGQSVSTVDITISDTSALSSGQQVLAFGFVGSATATPATNISDDINDLWTITLVDGTTIRLNGCSAFGEVGATGIISTGAEQWPNAPISRLYDFSGSEFQNNVQSGQIQFWYWNLGVMRFTPCSEIRQLKIVYDLSGTAPTSGTIGINDSLDALAAMTAALAARSKFGDSATCQELFMRAVGNPTGDTSAITGGYFAELAQIETQNLQKVRVVMPPFRNKRNAGWGWTTFGR